MNQLKLTNNFLYCVSGDYWLVVVYLIIVKPVRSCRSFHSRVNKLLLKTYRCIYMYEVVNKLHHRRDIILTITVDRTRWNRNIAIHVPTRCSSVSVPLLTTPTQLRFRSLFCFSFLQCLPVINDEQTKKRYIFNNILGWLINKLHYRKLQSYLFTKSILVSYYLLYCVESNSNEVLQCFICIITWESKLIIKWIMVVVCAPED